MDSYFGCCGMCKKLNLYDKYGGKFRCTELNHYFRADEKACSNRFESDSRRTPKDIEDARDGRLK